MKRFNVTIKLESVNADEVIQALQNLIVDIAKGGMSNQSLNVYKTQVGYVEVDE